MVEQRANSGPQTNSSAGFASLEFVAARYNEAIFDTDQDWALKIIRDALAQGFPPEDLVFHVVLPAMNLMEKSVSEDWGVNLAQHFLTARIAEAVTGELLPKFTGKPKIAGRVIIGTAWGDLHTLGKRIVIGCLKARMLEVSDLGVNVPAERFVDEAVKQGAPVIAVSALMLHAATGSNGPLKVRRLLRERNLERQIKLIVGGAPFQFNPELYRSVGADTWADNAIAAGPVIEALLKEAAAA